MIFYFVPTVFLYHRIHFQWLTVHEGPFLVSLCYGLFSMAQIHPFGWMIPFLWTSFLCYSYMSWLIQRLVKLAEEDQTKTIMQWGTIMGGFLLQVKQVKCPWKARKMLGKHTKEP